MAKGRAIYFTRKELENLMDFINHWDDKLLPDEEEYCIYWSQKIYTAYEKIYVALEKSKNDTKFLLQQKSNVI